MGPNEALKSPIKMRLGFKFHKDKDYVSLSHFLFNIHATSSILFGTEDISQMVVEWVNGRTMSLMP